MKRLSTTLSSSKPEPKTSSFYTLHRKRIALMYLVFILGAFLVGGVSEASNENSAADRGNAIFHGKGLCHTCHAVASASKQPTPIIAPRLFQVFGRTEQVYNAGTKIPQSVVVDEKYIRESIENPNAKQVVGFAPSMPPLKGILTENDISDLIAYIKTLK